MAGSCILLKLIWRFNMDKRSFALGVVHGYNGVIGGNPYVTEEDSNAYEEGYVIGYGYLEEELEEEPDDV